MKRTTFGAIAACALAITAVSAYAAEVIKPQIGEPLRDAAVTRAPDGTFYLVGTLATKDKKGSLDFHYNHGVRAWSSKDLQSWTDLGYLIDLRKIDSKNGFDARWQSELYPVVGNAPGDRGRSMTAPRLTYDGQRFWISYSMTGYGAGAMPSEGADIKGPYLNTKQLAEAGGSPTGMSDATVFVDKDGVAHLVWGGGCIAKLKSLDQMRAEFDFAKKKYDPGSEGAIGIEGPCSYLPALAEGYSGEDGLPERGAPYGVSVFLRDGRYAFLFTATTLRDGAIHEDSYISQSDKLLGRYSKPQPFILDSGRVTVFLDAGNKPRVSYSDGGNNPVIAAYPATLPSPAKTGAPKPKRGEIVTKISVPKPSEKPKDVKQLVEMIEPLFDHPLRDAALCYGPDGTAYLIGTEATQGKEGKLDWSNNNGIRLWSSTDQKTWKDLGMIWDCDKDGKGWHQESHLDLSCGATPKIGRAITAPEMHCVKGTFYIVYSLNGEGIGILKSSNGKAEGPYQDLGRIVKDGRDGSLLVDGETVYLVWGQGFYAKLSNDLTKLDVPVKTLFTNVVWYPRYGRRLEVIGQWGSHLIKADGWYIWTFTTRSGRLGNNSIETMASWSKSLDGPWGEPCLMLANGGQSTLVAAPASGGTGGKGKYYATVSGEDEYAQLPYLPAITEVVCANRGSQPNFTALSAYNPGSYITHHQAVNSTKATELDYWVGHPDLVPYNLRDIWMDHFDDGYYYVSGSFWAVPEWAYQVPFYRSKDKLHWEPIPGAIFKAEDRQPFEMKAYQFEGNVYASFNICRMPGVMLKSKSKSMNGPFEPLRSNGFNEYMADGNGSYLCCSPGSLKVVKDIKAFEAGTFEGNAVKLQHPDELAFLEDCETGLVKIDGKYVAWSTDWTGSYDMNYMVSESYKGPWRGLRVGLPHGGNSYTFKDKDGSWWGAYFMNTNDYATRSGNFSRLNMMPLHVAWIGDELIIEPKAVRKNRARLESLGAMWQTPRGDIDEQAGKSK